MGNAVIYARYSSHSQTEATIEKQIEECTKYAESRGFDIVGEYVDRAKTGTNFPYEHLSFLQIWYTIASIH